MIEALLVGVITAAGYMVFHLVMILLMMEQQRRDHEKAR